LRRNWGIPLFYFTQCDDGNFKGMTPDQWSEWGLKSQSAHCRSFRKRVFPVNHLLWYWQPNKNNQKTEHTNNTTQFQFPWRQSINQSIKAHL